MLHSGNLLLFNCFSPVAPPLFFSSHFLPSFPIPAIRGLSIRTAALQQPLQQQQQQLAEATEQQETGTGGGGPIELPPSSSSSFSSSSSSLFAVDDNPSPLQVATSVLLTGSITVFLFRSIRRRAKRAKELRVRSTGVKTTKDIQEEAMDALKAMGVAPVESGQKPPSPVQAMLGGIAAGVIALVLYKFATTVEASLNRQTISDNFSIRQITITIRTIVNGLCYLATFIFGINSVGLILYSVQLGINSLMESPANLASGKEDEGKLNVTTNSENPTDNVDSGGSDGS